MPIASRYFRVKGEKHYVWTRKGKVTDDEVKAAIRKHYDGDEGFEDVPF